MGMGVQPVQQYWNCRWLLSFLLLLRPRGRQCLIFPSLPLSRLPPKTSQQARLPPRLEIDGEDQLKVTGQEPVERLWAAFNLVQLTVLYTVFKNSVGRLDQDQTELVTEEDGWLVAIPQHCGSPVGGP
ncbi:hypothetical protein AOLI_G00277670 [Acnodon oligacanthus]